MKEEKNLELLKKAQSGDEEAKKILIEFNQGLVWNVVKRFLNRGYEKEELFQTGCIGLIKAINNFDFSYNVKFSTYAVPMIIGEIKRFLRDNNPIKVSRSLKETAAKTFKAQEKLSKKLRRRPTISEIAREINISEEDVILSLEASKKPSSLDEIAFQDDSSPIYVVDQIKNEETENDIINKIALKELINKLKPREKKIIILRYFRDMTQTQVAEKLGLSQVQVSRIEKKIIKKLQQEFFKKDAWSIFFVLKAVFLKII